MNITLEMTGINTNKVLSPISFRVRILLILSGVKSKLCSMYDQYNYKKLKHFDPTVRITKSVTVNLCIVIIDMKLKDFIAKLFVLYKSMETKQLKTKCQL